MQARNLKILGLSLLALVSVMAVNASAAQARWLLLLNGVSVNRIDVITVELLRRLSVPGLSMKIECKESTGKVAYETSEESKKLTVSDSNTAIGCVVVGGEEVCEVHSPGKSAGSIAFSSSGTAGMESEEVVTAKLSSSNFAEVEIDGEECALEGLDAKINGTIEKIVLEALKNVQTRLIHLVSNALFYGKEKITLESNEGPGVLGHETDPGGTWAFHLVNL